ncbi:MAG: hypothetical protein WBP58_16315 [Chitinophagaceae bacterium]
MSGKLLHCTFRPLVLPIILWWFFCEACTTPPAAPERAMYHWKSVYQPNTIETSFLTRHKIHTLYVKYFDVDADPMTGKPIPVATLNRVDPFPDSLNIVPVVFITQPALRQWKETDIDSFAQKISTRISQITVDAGLSETKEWQLDCDWTEKTKATYFRLVEAIKQIAHQQNITLSVTLRLYPYKYPTVMGVPPADKALLMCYNMGNLTHPATVNSIIDPYEMKKYLTLGQPYPLPLDAALPLFSWHVWFREKTYLGLVYPAELDRVACLVQTGNLRTFNKDTVIGGRLFQKGDWLREERSDIEDLIKAIELIRTKPGKQTIQRLALFHLDSLILNKYDQDALEALFGRHP